MKYFTVIAAIVFSARGVVYITITNALRSNSMEIFFRWTDYQIY